MTWWTRNDEDEPELSSDEDDNENEDNVNRRGTSSKGKIPTCQSP